MTHNRGPSTLQIFISQPLNQTKLSFKKKK